MEVCAVGGVAEVVEAGATAAAAAACTAENRLLRSMRALCVKNQSRERENDNDPTSATLLLLLLLLCSLDSAACGCVHSYPRHSNIGKENTSSTQLYAVGTALALA